MSIGSCATLACLLEATAPKPGNVHRGADFADMTFTDFVVSAAAIGPAMERAAERGVGTTVLEAVRATRRLVPVNTNLGTVLLLAPLAAVPRPQRLDVGVPQVLRTLLRVAQPVGCGNVATCDCLASDVCGTECAGTPDTGLTVTCPGG